MKKILVALVILFLFIPTCSKKLSLREQRALNKELIWDISSKDINKIMRLLDRGADVNSKDNNDTTILMMAAGFGQIETVQLLIERNASINTSQHDNWTALTYAADKGHLEIVKYLIAKGATIDGIIGSVALIQAANSDYLPVVRCLIEQGVYVNDGDSRNYTPLMSAAASGRYEIAKYLIENGSDVNLKDMDGRTALIYSSSNGNFELFRLLLDSGADINVLPNHPYFPMNALMSASCGGYRDIVQYLIEHKANINVKNIYNKTALDYAIEGMNANKEKMDKEKVSSIKETYNKRMIK